MIEDIPLFSMNLKIWKRCGFIESQTYWRNSFLIGTCAGMNLCQGMFIIKNWTNVEAIILSSFLAGALFNSIVRILSVLIKQRDFIKFMEGIVDWLKDAERLKDNEALDVFNRIGAKAEKLSKLSLTVATIGGVMTALAPLLIKRRGNKLPFSIWIPGIDVYESPYYEIFFGIQDLIVAPFIWAAYIPFTNLFICWLMFGIGCLQILQTKLEGLMKPSRTLEEIDCELAYCIEYHQRIIRFADQLNTMLSLTNLMEIIMFSLMLGILLFSLLIIESFMLQVVAVIYMACVFYAVLLLYWHANEFSYESLKVAEAAYNSDWTSGNIKLKRNILLIILRSQNALQISAGGLYPMTLEVFQSVLKTSYSCFTILKRMRQ